MNVEVKSIGCYQLKGEKVFLNGRDVISGDYWPPFMSNAPESCPIRAAARQGVGSFATCLSCEHAIVDYAVGEIND